MNTKIWNAQNWSVDVDEFVSDHTIFSANKCSSCKFKVSVEPGIPYAPSVPLCTDLDGAVGALVGLLLHSQTGRVSVRTHKSETISRLEITTHGEGSDHRLVTGDKELIAWLDI